MIYLLDISACSDFLRDDSATVTRLERSRAHDRLVTSSIVVGEIFCGIQRLPTGKKQQDLRTRAEAFLGSIDCEPVVPAVSRRFADLKVERQTAGRAIGENDPWIAAAALSLGATLVTRDSDYDGIEGLQIENWSA